MTDFYYAYSGFDRMWSKIYRVASIFERSIEVSEIRKLRPVENIEILIPALPRATKADILGLNNSFKWIKADDSPVEEIILTLTTTLFEGEWYIPKNEYLVRLRNVSNKLGFSQAIWLSENYSRLPESVQSVLRLAYIDFPATVVVGDDGYELIPYAYFVSGEGVAVSFDRLAHSFKVRDKSGVMDCIAVAKVV